MTGPLAGQRVVELAGLGPAPFAGMFLAELGAEVVRIERPDGNAVMQGLERFDLTNRGKRSVVLDLKRPEALAAARALVDGADVLLEGFRPGVAERIGLGPEECLERNPRLVYGRMTGWGQTGPLAASAGHDLDYIAVAGALAAIGPEGAAPAIPLNLVGDFGGGATYLVIGVLAALVERAGSGRGQVIDAAIVDGVPHLMASVHMFLAAGAWTTDRGVNLLDGGRPYYAVYRTRDGGHMAVAAVEPQFYGRLLDVLGIDPAEAPQNDPDAWASTRRRFEQVFAERTRAEWTARFEGTDACVAPVLDMVEAADHPQVVARGSLQVRDGVLQSQAAPRFSRSVTSAGPLPRPAGSDTRDVLSALAGLDVEALLASGAAVQA